MLLDGEGVDRADLRQRASHAAQLRVQRLVVERGQLGDQLLAGRAGSWGGASAGSSPSASGGAGLRQRVQGELALAGQRRQRLLVAGRLDRCGLRRRAPAPPAAPASASLALQGDQRRARSRSRSASRRAARLGGRLVRPRAPRPAAASSSARSTRQALVGDALRRDGRLRLHLARGLDRAAALCSELPVLDLAERPPGRRSRPRARGRAPGWLPARRSRRRRPPRRPGSVSAASGEISASSSAPGSAACDGGQLLHDARFGRLGSLGRELRRLQRGRRRALVAARPLRGSRRASSRRRPASVTAAIARAASRRCGRLLLRRSPPAPGRARGGVRDAARPPIRSTLRDRGARAGRAQSAMSPAGVTASQPARQAAPAAKQRLDVRQHGGPAEQDGQLGRRRSTRPASDLRRWRPARPRERRRWASRRRGCRRPAGEPIRARRPAARPARRPARAGPARARRRRWPRPPATPRRGASIPSSSARQPAAVRMEPSRPRPRPAPGGRRARRAWRPPSLPAPTRGGAPRRPRLGLDDRSQGRFVGRRALGVRRFARRWIAAARSDGNDSCGRGRLPPGLLQLLLELLAPGERPRRPLLASRGIGDAQSGSVAGLARRSSAASSGQVQLGQRAGGGLPCRPPQPRCRHRARQGVIGAWRGLRQTNRS